MAENNITLPQSFLDRINDSSGSNLDVQAPIKLPQSFLDRPEVNTYKDEISSYVDEDLSPTDEPYKNATNEAEINKQTKHYKELNQDAVELLKTEPQTYDSIKNNTEIQEAAVRMAEEYLGRENIRPEDALEEVLEHFNKFDVNELTAAYDFGYVSGLVSDIERAEAEGLDRKLQQKTQALNDYRLLFKAKNALPESENFGIKCSSNTVEIIMNYSSINTNRIKFGHSTSNESKDMGVICFSSFLLKEILLANKGFESGQISISEAGLAQVNFKLKNGESTYYLVQLQTS